MKRIFTAWLSFPEAHKRRFYQACGIYALLIAVTGAWVVIGGKSAANDWQSRIPMAEARLDGKPVTTPPKKTAPTVRQQSPVAEDSDIDAQQDGPVIAILVTGLGLSSSITEKALQTLPAGVSLAFSPYGDKTATWLDTARSKNRDTLIMVPMESTLFPKDDPGPRALSSRLGDRENNENINWVLSKANAAQAAVNDQGSRTLSDRPRLSILFNALKKKNLPFIEIKETDNSFAADVAANTGVPYMPVDLKIDSTMTETAIRAQLAALEKKAKERGYAIGIAAPVPLTMDILALWAPRIAEDGIRLAPVSSMWKNEPHHERRTITQPEQTPE